jgi:hypothetical protein
VALYNSRRMGIAFVDEPNGPFMRPAEYPIAGVRYNVVKRPGQYQGKKETAAEFQARLAEIIKENPGEFFMRWKVDITAGDVKRFCEECLNPILEQLCSWWEWIGYSKNMEVDVFEPAKEGLAQDLSVGIHWRHPFGVYNVLDEGGSSELDEYLASGSTVGLQKVDTLFGELA